MLYEVVDNEFNRANYPGEIGKLYASPPAYVAVREVVRPSEACPCDCKSLPEFTEEDAEKALDYIYGPSHAHIGLLLAPGMNEEREHCDITHGDSVQTARIALAHLKEDPEYYAKLKKAGL